MEHSSSFHKTQINALPVNYNVAGMNVLPEEQELWDNNNFNSEDEWMTIAYNSNIFDSEERARQVFQILSQQ